MKLTRQNITHEVLSERVYSDRHQKYTAVLPERLKVHLGPKDIIVRDFCFNDEIFFSEIGVIIGKANGDQGILISWFKDGNMMPVEVAPAFQIACGLVSNTETVRASFWRYWKLKIEDYGQEFIISPLHLKRVANKLNE